MWLLGLVWIGHSGKVWKNTMITGIIITILDLAQHVKG